LVGTGKHKGLESLSENREWRLKCGVLTVVPRKLGTELFASYQTH